MYIFYESSEILKIRYDHLKNLSMNQYIEDTIDDDLAKSYHTGDIDDICTNWLLEPKP